MINTIVHYIKILFGTQMMFLFVAVGLFLLIRDVPLLKRKMFRRESAVIRLLGYVYIFGSIILLIIVKFL